MDAKPYYTLAFVAVAVGVVLAVLSVLVSCLACYGGAISLDAAIALIGCVITPAALVSWTILRTCVRVMQWTDAFAAQYFPRRATDNTSDNTSRRETARTPEYYHNTDLRTPAPCGQRH